MRRIAAILAVVALLFSAGSAWADLDDGLTSYQRGDYATAFREWLPLAEQGDALAQQYLGNMYATGRGVPENDAEAFKWYGKAAARSMTRAFSEDGVGDSYEGFMELAWGRYRDLWQCCRDDY